MWKYETDRPQAFNREVAAYERRDRACPPAKGGVLFAGSSVMEMWETLADDLAPLPVINRAISGSKIVQWPHYVGRLVLPLLPSAVALYAGSNDMQGEGCKSPNRILEAFAAFARAVHEGLPGAKVWYLSILPSPAPERWGHWGRIHEANRLIEAYAKNSGSLGFVDATEAFLREGKPVPGYFVEDGVHLNQEGYARWAEVLRCYLYQH